MPSMINLIDCASHTFLVWRRRCWGNVFKLSAGLEDKKIFRCGHLMDVGEWLYVMGMLAPHGDGDETFAMGDY